MTYKKGQIDKGDLAGTYVVLVAFQNVEDSKNLAETLKTQDDPKRLMVTYHEVNASHYDIDYDMHKLLIYPGEPMEGQDDG